MDNNVNDDSAQGETASMVRTVCSGCGQPLPPPKRVTFFTRRFCGAPCGERWRLRRWHADAWIVRRYLLHYLKYHRHAQFPAAGDFSAPCSMPLGHAYAMERAVEHRKNERRERNCEADDEIPQNMAPRLSLDAQLGPCLADSIRVLNDESRPQYGTPEFAERRWFYDALAQVTEMVTKNTVNGVDLLRTPERARVHRWDKRKPGQVLPMSKGLRDRANGTSEDGIARPNSKRDLERRAEAFAEESAADDERAAQRERKHEEEAARVIAETTPTQRTVYAPLERAILPGEILDEVTPLTPEELAEFERTYVSPPDSACGTAPRISSNARKPPRSPSP